MSRFDDAPDHHSTMKSASLTCSQAVSVDLAEQKTSKSRFGACLHWQEGFERVTADRQEAKFVFDFSFIAICDSVMESRWNSGTLAPVLVVTRPKNWRGRDDQ